MQSQSFFSYGKLLLSGEYLVLDGAKALVLPCRMGQHLVVQVQKSANQKLLWRALDEHKETWFEVVFNTDDFSFENEKGSPELKEIAKRLGRVLKMARVLNPSFFNFAFDVQVETQLEFPREWGMGSSSTLINNIAQWAGVDALKLHKTTWKGSGYDIAAGASCSPILYQLEQGAARVRPVNFNPSFKQHIYFVYMNQKQNSAFEVDRYQKLDIQQRADSIIQISQLSEKILTVSTLADFEELIDQHEKIVSQTIQRKKIKDVLFKDYWGAVKSLGAWGGDFVLATSTKSEQQTLQYFDQKGYPTVLSFQALFDHKLS